jgi:ribose 1,5-bisphosphate isomerase
MTEKEVEQTIQDIKDLKVQGNTNIAKTVAKTLLSYATHTKVHNYGEFLAKLKGYAHELAEARPNEPMTVNVVAFILKDIEKCENQAQLRIKFIERIENFFKYLDESYEIIRSNAVNLLKGHKTFFTHCHSSLARDVLIRLHDLNNDILVINDETRPLFQGRITATKLATAGVNVLHIVDSAVGSIFLDKRYPKPEVVLVGCDGITVNGDFINKIGTLNIALAAREAGVPLYVVTQSMKIDFRNPADIEIELRAKDEIWKERPKNVEILNPAFDLVPGELVTGGFITEKGLMEAVDFKTLAH